MASKYPGLNISGTRDKLIQTDTAMRRKEYLKKIRKDENRRMRKLHDKVARSIDQEELIAARVSALSESDDPEGTQIADVIARFGGSWWFLIFFTIFIVTWLFVNLIVLSYDEAFDPYPFILLNLILSLLAAVQAPLIMMSQNRSNEKDRQRAEDDYVVNLKTEIEMRNLLDRVELLENRIQKMYKLQEVELGILTNLEKRMTPPDK